LLGGTPNVAPDRPLFTTKRRFVVTLILFAVLLVAVVHAKTFIKNGTRSATPVHAFDVNTTVKVSTSAIHIVSTSTTGTITGTTTTSTATSTTTATCPSCRNMAGKIFHERCQDLANGFRITANQGLTYQGYGLDDDSDYASSYYKTKSCHFYAKAFIKNTCYLAAFGDSGTVRHSLTWSSQKVGSGRKMEHWDCRSFGKTEFWKNDSVNWSFNTESGDTDYPVTELECQFEC